MKFAKLFDLPNGSQVLVQKKMSNENENEIIATTEIEGLTISAVVGFDSDDEKDADQKCDEAFEMYNEEMAAKFHASMFKTFYEG